MSRRYGTIEPLEIRKLDKENGKRIFSKYEYLPGQYRGRRVFDDCVGEMVYCTTDFLELFTKGLIYKIEKIGDKGYNYGKIKLSGIPGFHNAPDFDFIENQPSLYRDMQLNELLDLKPAVELAKNKERKINTLPFKNRVLAQSVFEAGTSYIGTGGYETRSDISFDKLVLRAMSTRGYKKFQMKKEDYDELANITLREFFDNFIEKLD